MVICTALSIKGRCRAEVCKKERRNTPHDEASCLFLVIPALTKGTH